MPTEEEQVAQEGQAVVALRKELLNTNFDGAKVIEREQMVPPQAVASVVNSVYDTFISTEKFIEAIEIGKKYDLPKDKINDAIYSEFRRIISTGEIDKAIEWALLNSLPDYEITRAAIKGIETAIINKNIELALDIKKKYSITEEQIGNVWQKGYDEAIAEENYFNAALLSREFGMSERKTIITAAKAFRKAMLNVDYDRMVLVDDEFRLFNDAGFVFLGDEDSRSLIKEIENFMREKLRTDDFKKVVGLILGLGVIFKEITNHTLKDLIHFVYTQSTEIHQFLLNEKHYDDAMWFVNELNLLESNTPAKTLREIFNQAVSYHNKFLKDGNFSLAMKVKQDYDLLGANSDADSIDLIQSATVSILAKLIEKGDTKVANVLIKEYNIPQNEIENVATEAVINSLKLGKYEQTIDIVTKFHVDISNFDITASAKEAFDQCRNNGYHETAADIGYIFEIDSPEVKDTARLVWEDLMHRQEYKKAAVIKKKHKLTKRYTDAVSKEVYNQLIEVNDIETARKVREEYRVNIGILTWIMEFFKKLLLLIFRKEEQPELSPLNDTEEADTPEDAPSNNTTQSDQA